LSFLNNIIDGFVKSRIFPFSGFLLMRQ